MRALPLGLALLAISAPASAEEDRLPTIALPRHAEPPTEPPTGLGWLVGGGLAIGAGVVNLVGAGLCVATLPQAQRVPCAGTSVAFGLAFLGAGIPLLVVGADKRERWRLWLDRVTAEPRREGFLLGYRGAL